MRVALVLSIVLGCPAWASAHLDLTMPPSRYGPEVLKDGPCGIPGGVRSENVTYFEPGETIEVRWDEYVDHPGHYRIAFDPDGDDDFVDPSTMMELYSNEAVLLDGIEDEGPQQRYYSVQVTLPDLTCDNCTLQVIQMMYDKPPYTTPGNDIYYQCADLVLSADGTPDGGAGSGSSIDAGTGDASTGGAGGVSVPGTSADGGGCSAAPKPRKGFATVCLMLLLLGRRFARRRRLPV